MSSSASLSVRLSELVRALFTGIVIESDEHPDALSEIARLCRDRSWPLRVWDIDRGLGDGTGGGDPLAPLQLGTDPDTPELFVLVNYHRYLGSPEIVQTLHRRLVDGRQDRTIHVLLSPSVDLPPELVRLFTVVRHELPDRDQLREIAEGIGTGEGEMPSETNICDLLDAASGLTRLEAENAFSLSLVREDRLAPEVVWDRKIETLGRDGTLKITRGNADPYGTRPFDQLGGLAALKLFATRSLQRSTKIASIPRGILLLGCPGVGKSAFCRALGAETGRPTVHLDVGSLLGSLVGQSEANLRRALATIDALGPCVVFLDEVEKALAGTGSSGPSDSGTTARLFGTLLTWLESGQRNRQAYVVASANDISRLPPEFTRAGRFDAVFFLDLPDEAVRGSIWPIHLDRFGLDATDVRPDDTGWTGAEIESCCRLASLLDLSIVEAAKNVVPVASTAAEQVRSLRQWASGRCLDADAGGLYRFEEPTRNAGSGSRRRTVRPSAN